VYLVIVTHARPRESTLFKYLHTFFSGIAVMWDTCKGWWEGKIKVEVDEVLAALRRAHAQQQQCPTYRTGHFSNFRTPPTLILGDCDFNCTFHEL